MGYSSRFRWWDLVHGEFSGKDWLSECGSWPSSHDAYDISENGVQIHGNCCDNHQKDNDNTADGGFIIHERDHSYWKNGKQIQLHCNRQRVPATDVNRNDCDDLFHADLH